MRLAEQGLAQGRQENDALRVRVTEQEQKLHDSEMERRCLHNMVQELKVSWAGGLRGWGPGSGGPLCLPACRAGQDLMGPSASRGTSVSSAACAPCWLVRSRPRRGWATFASLRRTARASCSSRLRRYGLCVIPACSAVLARVGRKCPNTVQIVTGCHHPERCPGNYSNL